MHALEQQSHNIGLSQAQGPVGPEGLQGVQGLTGPQGIQGPAGPQGPSGNPKAFVNYTIGAPVADLQNIVVNPIMNYYQQFAFTHMTPYEFTTQGGPYTWNAAQGSVIFTPPGTPGNAYLLVVSSCTIALTFQSTSAAPPQYPIFAVTLGMKEPTQNVGTIGVIAGRTFPVTRAATETFYDVTVAGETIFATDGPAQELFLAFNWRPATSSAPTSPGTYRLFNVQFAIHEL